MGVDLTFTDSRKSSAPPAMVSENQNLQLAGIDESVHPTEDTVNNSSNGAQIPTAIRRMSGMVDKEFQEGNLDIFGVYEFAMLSDDAIQQLLISRGVIHPEINVFNIIKKEFSVAYEYAFKAWIEERSFSKRIRTVEKTTPLSTDPTRISDPWDERISVRTPSETYSQSCKNKVVNCSVITCGDCDGKGRKYCGECKSTGFVGCPQCRGIGFGNNKYMGSSKGMMASAGSRSNAVCMRCRGQRTVPCNTCGASFSKGNICKQCQGKGKVKSEKLLKVSWSLHDDHVAVGKHTSKIPDKLIFDAYGVSIHDNEEPLDDELCPDRPDIVELSRNNPLRVRTSTPGRLIKRNHFLKAVPVCAASAAIRQPDGRQILKTYFIVGQINCGLWEITHNVALGTGNNFFQFNGGVGASKKKTSSLWKRAAKSVNMK